MIPVLYESTETAFTSNGLGRLTECTACTVTEERNGEFEAQFTYPISGRLYAELTEGRIISCTHDDDGTREPFIIYKRSAPINGLVVFSCRHISYRLSNIILNPFEAVGVVTALQGIAANSINTNPFTFVTDKTTLAPFSLDHPASVRAIMGGSEGSLLDVYGGEYEYNGFTVHLWAHRGQDAGVSIRYGKNMSDMVQTVDTGAAYNAVVPYWLQDVDGVQVLVVLPERIVTAQGVTDPCPVALDMTDDFDEQPTEAQLRQAAADFLANNEPWTPLENITVDFVQLWNTTEYASVANLQKVRLCDTVSVYYKAAGIQKTSMKVIKTVYNVLTDRFDEIELGEPVASFADTILKATERQITQSERDMTGFFDEAIQAATDRITGATGGHIVLVEDANGKPQELLIIDGNTLATSTNILRMNLNGIGFSTDGGRTYATAWTIDGQFVADFITAGTLKSIRIEGPNTATYWDLATGILQSYGVRTLSATVTASDGTQTAITYDTQEKTRIDAGVVTVTGKKATEQEETVFSDFGVRAADVDKHATGGVTPPGYITDTQAAYPHGGMTARGAKVTGRGGTGDTLADDLQAVTYNPIGMFSPDTLILGQTENPVPNIGVDRNVLKLNGGWNAKEDAVQFWRHVLAHEVYDVDEQTWLQYYDFTQALPSSPVWDMVPGDQIEIPCLFLFGILNSSKNMISFQLPLCRPVTRYGAFVHADGTIHARQTTPSALLCNNELFDTLQENGAHYFSEYYTSESGIAVRLHHWGKQTWSNGTAYAPVFITLADVTIKILSYDENAGGGPT